MVFCFWSLKRITWARRRQIGLISPEMPAPTGSGTMGVMQSPPPRSEALPGTATMTMMSPLRKACGLMTRAVQAAMPQLRNIGTTVTTGGTQAAMLVRSQDGVLPNHMLGTWVATRPGLTLRPALPLPCRRRVSLGTPALLITHSLPVLRQRQRTTMPPRARRAPGRPTRGLLQCSQRQNRSHSHRCRVGRQLQDHNSHSHHRPGRCPRARHHASHRCSSSSSSSHNSSHSNNKVWGSKLHSRLHHRLGCSNRASQRPGAQPLLPVSQQGNLSQALPQPQGPSQQDW